MGKPISILMVEDNPADAGLIFAELTAFGYEPTCERVETAGRMNAELTRRQWDCIIADYRLPQFSGMAALSLLKQSGLDIPFIIISGFIGEEMAVSAMKSGADDYITKNDLTRLPVAIEREITAAMVRKERRQARDKLEFLASHNPLTGLLNRGIYMARLTQAMDKAKRAMNSAAIMVIDLNRFRDVNDAVGHLNGNALLQQIAARLQETLNAADTVAHLGEDKFGVILYPANLKDATWVADQIRQALQKPFEIAAIPMHVEVNIGIAGYPDHGEEVYELLQRVEEAMVAAQETGSGYFVYTPDRDDQHSTRQLALLGELQRGIETDQLVLHYQPKVDRKTFKIVAVEALVRWQHPEHGLLEPGQFLPVAEKTGLIKPLAFWTIHAAIEQCARWQTVGLEIDIVINLSAQNLHDEEIITKISEALTANRIAPERLRLDFTESAIMSDLARAEERLNRLSKMGIGISLDGFGTGYSALPYLKKLPVDEVKVDRSFIIGMMDNEKDYVLAYSLIELGRNLGLTTVAEGVENEAIFKRLADFGCDLVQGGYISWPLPADQVIGWISESPYLL